MLIKDLGGHSGCKILLIEENGEYFVRKYSSSLEYNKRLEKQCTKQDLFIGKTVKTPAILRKGYDDKGVFYFDMEFVKGVTLAKHMSKIDVSEIKHIANVIVQNIDFATEKLDSSNIFISKIIDLKNQTANFDNENIRNAIDFLLVYDWSGFSKSACHGDLTLENIIVKNGEMYFIDFLDSFYDSWLLDIGKILQDAECLWSYRNDVGFDTNTKIRLIILKEILISQLKEADERYVTDAYAALLLHLLRIYPYTNDEHTYVFLNKQVSKVLDRLRGGL